MKTTPTQSPLVLPKHGSTIIFTDKGFVSLVKNGAPYLVTHERRGKLSFTWAGGRSVDCPASTMRSAAWREVAV